ncbi:MAG: hypothetical protein RLZZ265_83 [Verrucomicrobiota bacterium]|jgi:hypothetical protein
MKSADISQYLSLRNALLAERASLQARLQEIATALDEGSRATSKASAGGRRVFSAATKAKMAASQRARWAAKLAGKAPASAVAPKAKAKRKLSAEGRAKIIAATKARWAKVRAAKAKAAAGGK